MATASAMAKGLASPPVGRHQSFQLAHGNLPTTNGDGAACRSLAWGFLNTHNRDPKPLVWTKSDDAILDNLRRYREDANATREQRMLRQMSRTPSQPTSS